MKVPWRFGGILLGGLSFFSACLSAQTRPTAPTGHERILFDSANRERASRHLSALHWDDNLARAARDHAWLMARSRSISHQFSSEPGLSTRLLKAGVHSSLVAENVGDASDAPELHAAWMKSSGHRANILEPNANAVGIAVVERGGLIYAVEDFARITTQIRLEEQERRVGAQLAARGLRLVDTTASVRQTCALSRGVASGLHPKFLFRYLTVDIDVLPDQLLAELSGNAGKYHSAAVGACSASDPDASDSYRVAVLLY